MSRSTKKGYYVQDALMKKVEALNAAFSLNSSATQLLYTTVTSMFRYTLLRTW